MAIIPGGIFIRIYSLFCILGIVLNLGTMVAVVACRRLRKTQNIFTFNVALGDFIAATMFVISEVIFSWFGVQGTVRSGKIVDSFMNAAWMVSIFCTLAVAVHRFIIIRLDPFQTRGIVTATRCVITCVIMWAVALVFYQLTSFNLVFPVSIMCAISITAMCYIVVYITISKPPGDIGLSSDAYLLRVERNKKVLFTFILVVFSNFACWVVYCFNAISFSIRPLPSFIRPNGWFENFYYIGMWLVSINTVINPILYWTRLSDFRRLICSCCCRRDLKDSLPTTKDSKIESGNSHRENEKSMDVSHEVNHVVTIDKENGSA